MALIELAGVSRRFRLGDTEVAALQDLTLNIEAGEFVAIMGASGSGKSTLMNVLGGLDQPSEGSFRIAGQDVAAMDADALAALRRDHFGFIFQRYHLLPHLDAQGNAALPAIYAGQPRAQRQQRAAALLARLGLAERQHHKPNELSGGQQQRVSIARALMNGGQVILADEPTGALDSASGAELLRLLGELNAAGHTIVLVTHDAAVAAHARRILEMRDGRLISDRANTPHAQPASPSEPKVDNAALPELPSAPAGHALQRWRHQWGEALHSAWSAMRANRLRTALSMLGISIGIASVVSIVAVTGAARDYFEGQLQGMISGRLMVFRGNPNLPRGVVSRPFQARELAALRSLPGVADIQQKRELQATARHRSRDGGVTVVGADLATLNALKLSIAEGRNLNALDLDQRAQVVVLDEKAREALFKPGEPALGQTLLLDTTGAVNPAQPGAAAATSALPLRVVGLAQAQAGGLNTSGWNGRLLLPLTTYTRKLDASGEVNQFEVMLDFRVPPDQVRQQVVHRLKAMHGQEDFGIWNADEEFRRIQQITGGLAAVFAGIGTIALVVGGVGVMNIMLVSVSERTREIGIRMAIGARQADVRRQFLIEAVLLCCLGGLVGVALSWLGAQVINQVQHMMEVRISLGALALAFGVSSAVGLVFGTLPARRAAALNPVEALARE